VAAEWPQLRYLSLDDNELTDAGLKALARWPGLARLVFLEVSPPHGKQFSPAAFRAFGNSPYVANLEYLSIARGIASWNDPLCAVLRQSKLTGLRICDLFLVDEEDERNAWAEHFPRLIGCCCEKRT
jgi:hypothetical protein